MSFKHQVEAQYNIVEGSPKDILKKALLPALMLLGPAACGTQEGHKDKRTPSTLQTHQAENTLNQALKSQDVKCAIKFETGYSTWTFKSTDDTLVLRVPHDEDRLDRNTIEVVKDPKSDSMDQLKEALLDSFSFGWEHVKDKYECKILNPQSRDLPAKNPGYTKPSVP